MNNRDMVYNDSEEQEVNVKEEMAKILFNEKSINMITFTQNQEIHRLGVLLVLTEEENKLRRTLKINEDNILTDVINKQLVLRTSLQGRRAKQGVKIISSILDEQKIVNNDLSTKLNKVIKGV